MGCLRLRFPFPFSFSFSFFFFTWALVLRFHCYLLYFSIMFTSNGWLHYPNLVFPPQMFLQIKDT